MPLSKAVGRVNERDLKEQASFFFCFSCLKGWKISNPYLLQRSFAFIYCFVTQIPPIFFPTSFLFTSLWKEHHCIGRAFPLITMDVSQFLKSFKKNVAAKAKSAAAATPDKNTADDDESEAEELRDLIQSDSDHEAETPSSDYVVGSRADRISSKRYGAHQKRNQDFDALRVFSTNASSAGPSGRRLQRQRSAMAQSQKSTQHRPRAELVASVRAELLRQREQLQRAQTSSIAATSVDNEAESPVAQVSATMVQVEELLSAPSSTARSTNAAASVLDFLPTTPSTPGKATTAEASRAVIDASVTAAAAAPAVSPLLTRVSGATAMEATAMEATETLAPAKKRSKFELAVAMAKAEEDS